MRPRLWEPRVKPSPAEQAVMKAVRRAKLFVFLHEDRHELFDERLQGELALASGLVRDRGSDLAVYCKAWRVCNAAGRCAKDQFSIDFTAFCPLTLIRPRACMLFKRFMATVLSNAQRRSPGLRVGSCWQRWGRTL